MKHLLPVGLVLLALLACKPSERREQANKIAKISISAQALYSAYDANEVAADEMYRDRNLRVTGTVESIGKDILDLPYVVLKSGAKYSIGGVQCFFDYNSPGLSSLSKGQTVTLTGLCKGKSIGSVLLK